jgi:hypothetical protein
MFRASPQTITADIGNDFGFKVQTFIGQDQHIEDFAETLGQLRHVISIDRAAGREGCFFIGPVGTGLAGANRTIEGDKARPKEFLEVSKIARLSLVGIQTSRSPYHDKQRHHGHFTRTHPREDR